MRYELPSLIRTLYFQPEDVDIPQGGFPAHFPFQFNPLAPMDVQDLTRVVPRDVLLYASAGNFTGGSASTGCFGQLFHVHNGLQIPMFSKPAPLENFCGSGQKPLPWLPTYFIAGGDSLTLQVHSQDRTNNLTVEVDLFATTINTKNLDKFQKAVLDRKKSALAQMVPPNMDLSGDQTPPSAMPFNLSPVLTPYPLPGAGPVTIQTYQVPPGQRTRFYSHALQHVGGNPPELSTSGVIWRFLVNQVPLKGMGVVTTQIGAFATPVKTVIYLSENDLFQVTVEIPASGKVQAGQSGYYATGWTAPILATGSNTQ